MTWLEDLERVMGRFFPDLRGPDLRERIRDVGEKILQRMSPHMDAGADVEILKGVACASRFRE